MRRLLAAAVVAVVAFAATGCASVRARHVAAVSVVSAHAVLKAIDDTEQAAACGMGDAPPAPYCVERELHMKISDKLADAYKLDAQAARVVQAWRPADPKPAEVANLLAQLTVLINDVLAMLPDAPWKTKLLAVIGGKP